MLVLYFNNIVAVVLEHYIHKKERNNQTDKQCKETLGTKLKCGSTVLYFP